MGKSEGNRELKSPAQVYDELFVPALFRQWAGVVADEAGVSNGDEVLDVACGTGVLACEAGRRAGDARVVGLDPNDDMLGVARRKNPAIDWRPGRAEALPFADASFDCVVSQFGLMFFEDRAAGLREMLRVLRPGGRLAIAVCDALDHSPGYAVLAELLQRLFGQPVADAFRAPFALGDVTQLRTLCEQAGVADTGIVRRDGTVRFDSIDRLVGTKRACVWPLVGLLDEPQFERLRAAANESLAPFVGADGAVQFVMPALIVRAIRRTARR